MHLLIEGPIGVGKSTLLLRELRPFSSCTAGFGVVRLLGEEGETAAFCLKPAGEISSPAEPYVPGAGIFLERTHQGWRRRPEVFSTLGVSLLRPVPGTKFILLDEIGGFELHNTAFMEALEEALHGDIPCVGVLKSPGNQACVKQKLHLGQEQEELYERFRARILQDTRITLLPMNSREDPEILRALRKFFSP